ncbi:type II toxin-antitoxin system RelE/ParE family toxin [Sphingomonas sp. 1P06PA]|uniref:type II toxin-antitoxin system RelE/ParE family toxin n=1 Tax=Sphingomonas sp. 1P06PA TaxID=554121 RepID=UPI0039A73C18
MPELSWTPAALADLRRINDWLNREASPEIALRTLTAIKVRNGQLAEFPLSGRAIPNHGFRVLPILGTRHLLAYRFDGGAVDIIRVYQERQNWRDSA